MKFIIVFLLCFSYDTFHYEYPDLDISNYVAGAISVFDLKTLELKWHLVLDVTTDNTEYKVFFHYLSHIIILK